MSGATEDARGPGDATDPDVTQPWQPPAGRSLPTVPFPTWLGSYRRDRELGRGGMGVVIRYRDTKLDRLVAVKALPPGLTGDPERRARFYREAKVVASLDHRNIARVYHALEHEGIDYLILEYVPGRTLSEVISEGALSLEQTLRLGLQIIEAVISGHACRVIHRDIKPPNIMVTPAETAKLLDYGLAHVAAPDVEPGPDVPSDVVVTSDDVPMHATRGGRAMGTPGYMSPEQTRGEPVDERTDVWAIGCVLYECLSGARAFPGNSWQERFAATATREPDWGRLPASTPRTVVDVLRTCLEKRIERRYRDAEQLRDQFLGAMRTRLETVEPVGTNLPEQLSTFIGRDTEIAQIRSLMRSSRLLTIIGAGGSGKSRLATEVAGRSCNDLDPDTGEARFADGVWLVELAPLTDQELVGQAIASALRGAGVVQLAAAQSPTETLVEHLAGRSALIVLDNCEHVLAGCAAAVTELLVGCPQVRVIATSREALGIPGEQSFPVTGLAYPHPDAMDDREIERCEAVRLFVARAEMARPGFSFTGKNAAAGAEICRRLEGVPLAIELAASRVRAMPVTKIAENLLEVLDPTCVLESSIAWSVDMLSPLERTMLGRLSVFRGGWTLEAAEALCADPRGRTIKRDEVLGLLTQLVDKSLVLYEERDDRARYHLLETVREYGHKHLIKSRSLTPVGRRHLDFFLDLTEEASAGFDGEDQVAWLDRLESEHENLRGALEFSRRDDVDVEIGMRMCIALNPFWCVHGYLGESRAHLEHVLAGSDGADEVLRIRAENQAGIVAERQGNLRRAREHYESGLAVAREIGDERRAAGVLTNLGLLAQDEGDFADSRRRHEEGMALYEKLGEAYGVAMVQLNLAVVAKLEGPVDEARRLLDACLPVFREHGDTQRIAAALHNLGEATLRDGSPGAARAYLEESLAIRREMRDKLATAQTMLWLAVSAATDGRPEQAATLLAMAESIRRDADAPLAPTDAAEYDRCVQDVRTRLGKAAFDTAWGAGSTMAFDQATGYAIHLR